MLFSIKLSGKVNYILEGCISLCLSPSHPLFSISPSIHLFKQLDELIFIDNSQLLQVKSEKKKSPLKQENAHFSPLTLPI